MAGLCVAKASFGVQSSAMATNQVHTMEHFDELAGRIEGLARAVLLLARMMERETDMDGLTLSRQWRESMAPQTGNRIDGTARKTLHEMAQALDDARSQHQRLLLAEVFRREQEAAAPTPAKAPEHGPG